MKENIFNAYSVCSLYSNLYFLTRILDIFFLVLFWESIP